MHPKRTSSVVLLVLLTLLLATASLTAAPAQRAIPADGAAAALPQTADADIAAKISSAMGAAPLSVAMHATIKDWPGAPGEAMTELRAGDNGYTCLPDRVGTSHPDPMCLDDVWLAWMAAKGAGEDPPNETVGIGYMLAGGAAASTSDPNQAKPAEGEDWIKGPPHLMIILPFKLSSEDFPTSPDGGGAWIMFADTPYEHLMIPATVDANPHALDRMVSALSAAPDSVSQHAVVKEWPSAPGEVMTEMRAGTNGITCLPDRLGTSHPDPMCLDDVWMAWMAAKGAGEDPPNETVGIGYMLQGGAAASTSDPYQTAPAEGEDWVKGPPHLMIIFPQKLSSDDFPTSPDGGIPWIMFADTPYEHLMIPTNLGLSDAQTKRALLPLPESLQASANIVGFDSDWNQVMVRAGSSDMNCIAFAPFMAIQYAVCQHNSSEAFWVMGMKLRAGGMSQEEIDQTRINAEIDGSLETPVVGAARYFLLGGRPQNLSSLMAVHLPNATAESTGFSTEPDNYRPWLMDAGTPNAHVMMPGN